MARWPSTALPHSPLALALHCTATGYCPLSQSLTESDGGGGSGCEALTQPVTVSANLSVDFWAGACGSRVPCRTKTNVLLTAHLGFWS